MKKVTYHIPAISCGHCIATIERELKELEGISDVKAQLESKTVTVEFDPPTTEEKIKATLVEINYPPEEVK